ncbi:hypothetical protein MYA_0480 [Burkholderia sp. KJ006]|nr:hypothetical protein MYA_0480 [Burkholderia sp. KJ006]
MYPRRRTHGRLSAARGGSPEPLPRAARVPRRHRRVLSRVLKFLV